MQLGGSLVIPWNAQNSCQSSRQVILTKLLTKLLTKFLCKTRLARVSVAVGTK